MGVYLSAILLIMGSVSIIYGVHFFRTEKNAGYFRLTMLLLGFFAGAWQIGYGLFGLVDDFKICEIIRKIALIGVCAYPLVETNLALGMSDIKKTVRILIGAILTVISVTDWILFSRPNVDVFVRVGNWTSFKAVDCPERSFHSIFVAVLFSSAFIAWLLWYMRIRHKREKALLYGILFANLAIMVGAIPDTFIVKVLNYGLPTSGLGACMSFLLWYVAAEKYNTFSISSKTLGNYAQKVLNEGIIILGENRMVVELNDYARNILGFMPGHSLKDMLESDETEDAFFSVLEEEKEYRFKCRIKGRDEIYMANARVALDNYGESYGYIMSFNDITKEEELVIEAESSNRAKSNFLANMSHEIRTPMNAICGMAEFILRDSNDEEARKNAAMITTASNSLLYIINDILDFSKIESGRMEIMNEPYQMASLINDVSMIIKIRLEGKPVEFSIDVDPDIPGEFIGDEVRIKQILINLLGNAVKFTKEGEIKLSIKCEMRPDDSARILFAVSDTGIGIKPEDLNRIFESFTQVDAKRNRSVEGTGLGLAISKQLTEAMGGELKAESVFEKGSVFSFDIINKVKNKEPMGVLAKSFADRKIKAFKTDFMAEDAKVLVVDDNDLNIKVAEGLLKAYGIKPVCVGSGIAAVRCVEKMEPFDLILMDHMMPGMDGVEAAGEIRKLPSGADVKIVALTANAVVGSAQKYLDAGFDGFIPKPVEAEKMDEILRKFIPDELIKAI